MKTLAQIVGFFAVIVFLLSYQQKRRNGIILLNVISRAMYILQYILLGAFSGAILDIMGALSSAVAANKHTDFIKKHIKTVVISINSLMIITGVTIAIINKSWLDLFSLTGVLLHTSAFWINDERIIRRVSLLGSPFWFIYNFFSYAYGSALGDLLTIFSILIAMYRHRQVDKEC